MEKESKTLRRMLAAVSAICLTLPTFSCANKPTESTVSEESHAGTTVSETSAAVTETTPADSIAEEHENPAPTAHYSLSRDGYELEQVVILSRHNIRSPMSTKGSVLDEATPHDWFEWTSDAAELSLRGGASETVLGQYFKQWLEQEGFFEKNYRPADGEVRFYSNSKQRTIATANCFLTGLLPTADTQVEYHMEFDKMDPVFTPQLTFVSDAYADDARQQIEELFADKIAGLSDNYALLSDIIDIEDSKAYQDGTLNGFSTDDTELVLELEKEPGMTGSLKTACSISDALVLQYYEEPDAQKAAFGHEIGIEEWKQISEIKDLYGDVLFTAPLIAPNVAHPLLEEIVSEFDTDGRKFTFLCGHDSNVGSVLAALEADEYTLPEAIESKTPIGCKLVFSRWKNESGERFISCDLVYPSVEQLRSLSLLNLDHSPVVYPMSFAGLEQVEDGMYRADDLLERFETALSAYDNIVEEYSLAEAA